jgi:hypothetical protein
MDSMHWWGRNKSNQWFEDVIYILEQALDNNIKEDRKELVRAMILVQVRAEIHVYFAIDSVAAELLWIDWVVWFNGTYKDGPKSFHAMSLYRFEYVRWRIAQVNYHANLLTC